MQKFVCLNNSRGIDLERSEGIGTEKLGNCPNSLHKSKSDFLMRKREGDSFIWTRAM